jgi:hypothetical protein
MGKLTANSPVSRLLGPVRKIGVQSRSITGTLPDGNRYESALERDFMLLLQFDHAVDVYSPQPVTITYQAPDGAVHRYTPDGLIQWHRDLNVHDPRPVLVEIKYRESFHGAWRDWRMKFRAARNYASERGWIFEVHSEREIRTPFLNNVKFLLPYRRHPTAPDTETWVLEKLAELSVTTVQGLIRYLYRDKWNQAAILPLVWKLLADRRIGCDLIELLTMASPIWSIWD